jgi:RNA polymerase sigma-70 factor (ECF subfamily)
LNERSDEELVAAYQKGEARAFEFLLKRHETGVFNFTRRMLGNRMEAEEVTQESFLRFIRAASRYRSEAGFRNYLYRIARNLCLDLLRKRSRGGGGSPGTATPDGSLESVPNGNPGPDDQADARRTRQALQQALQALPPEQREVFLLKEVRDLKLQDVAAVTGANINTVKSRLRYALHALREQLTREGLGKETGHAV